MVSPTMGYPEAAILGGGWKASQSERFHVWWRFLPQLKLGKRQGFHIRAHICGRGYGIEKTGSETGSVIPCPARTLIFSDSEIGGAEEGTRTPTPLRVHGPEPCASANSATSARSVSRDT